jgi:methylated-DNA-protein-cysteine methyltransferase-like protein
MTAHFVSPPEPAVYNATVWEIVRQIPAGRVSTYGQIAAMIPPPGGLNVRDYEAFGARWVGGAMAACPAGVPWQRVINAQGKISLRQGATKQRELLEAEGVPFDERDRVDLKKYGWDGPPEAWLKAHGLLPPPRFSHLTQTGMNL